MTTNCSSHKCRHCGRFIEASTIRHPSEFEGLGLLNGDGDIPARGSCPQDGTVDVICVRIGTRSSS